MDDVLQTPPHDWAEPLFRELEDTAKHGRPRRVHDMLANHPRLWNDRETLLDLIDFEWKQRQDRGEVVSLSEYQELFPHLSEELARQYSVFSAMTAAANQQLSPATRALGQAPVQPCDERPELPNIVYCGQLGRGTFGTVYLGRDTVLQRHVAVKVVKIPEGSDEARNRMLTEVRAMAKLSNDNVLRVHRVDALEGQMAIVMEYAAGGTLQSRLGSPLSPTQAVPLLLGVVDGVAAAHRAGIVHRDLKPANVLLDKAGGVKVADFGLAKDLEATVGNDTASNATMGTPLYMSPEQATGRSAQAGPSADVWALGVMLYEMLTGICPFRGESQLELLKQVESAEPVAVRALMPSVPRDLETICHKCLQKEPGRRYANAGELADDLRRWQRGEPIHARPVGRLERAGRWAKRNPRVAGLGAAVVALLIVLAVGGWTMASWALQERNIARGHEQTAIAKEQIAIQARERAEKIGLEMLDALEKNLSILLTQPVESKDARKLRSLLLGGFVNSTQKLLTLNPESSEQKNRVAGFFNRIANNLAQTDQVQLAIPYFQAAIRLFLETGERGRAAMASSNLAFCYIDSGDGAEAEEAIAQGVRLFRELLADEPNNRDAGIGIARELCQQAEIAMRLPLTAARRQLVEQNLVEAEQLWAKIIADDPQNLDNRLQATRVLNKQSGYLNWMGKNAESLETLKVLARQLRELECFGVSNAKSFLVETLSNIGAVQNLNGNFIQAATSLLEAMSHLDELSEQGTLSREQQVTKANILQMFAAASSANKEIYGCAQIARAGVDIMAPIFQTNLQNADHAITSGCCNCVHGIMLAIASCEEMSDSGLRKFLRPQEAFDRQALQRRLATEALESLDSSLALYSQALLLWPTKYDDILPKIGAWKDARGWALKALGQPVTPPIVKLADNETVFLEVRQTSSVLLAIKLELTGYLEESCQALAKFRPFEKWSPTTAYAAACTYARLIEKLSADKKLDAAKREALLTLCRQEGVAALKAWTHGDETLWEQIWYRVEVLEHTPGICKIHYVGWDSKFDEEVATFEVRTPKSRRVAERLASAAELEPLRQSAEWKAAFGEPPSTTK